MASLISYRRYLPYLLAAAGHPPGPPGPRAPAGPALHAGSADMLDMSGSDDPLYNFRQVDQILHNYPAYAWFDAMTLFPPGNRSTGGRSFPPSSPPSASSREPRPRWRSSMWPS